MEPWRQMIDAIAMTHPDRYADGIRSRGLIERVRLGGGGVNAGEDTEKLLILCCFRKRFERGGAIFAAPAGGGNMSAQLMGQKLHTIANTQDGQAAVQDGGIAEGRALVIDAGRAT